jgi:hypothetical protein
MFYVTLFLAIKIPFILEFLWIDVWGAHKKKAPAGGTILFLWSKILVVTWSKD